MPIPPEDRLLIFGADIDIAPFNQKLNQMAQGVTSFGINYTQQLEKLSAQQAASSQKLISSQQALKSVNQDVINKQEDIANRQKNLNANSERDVRTLKERQDELQKVIDLQKQLTLEVEANQKAYEELTKKVEDFTVAAKGVTQGDLPFPGATPPGELFPAAPGAPPGGGGGPPIPPITDKFLLSLKVVKPQMDELRAAIEQARGELQNFDRESVEFAKLSLFITTGTETIEKYDSAVKLATETTEQFDTRIKSAQQTLQTINTASVERLPVEVAKSRREMEQLSDAVQIAKSRLETLNPDDAEFPKLTASVAEGEKTLDEYTQSLERSSVATTTFRTQMIEGQQALAKMIEEGKEGTEEFDQMQIHVAKLTREYRIQHEQLRVLSSETKALDLGKSVIQAGIAGFEAYTAVTILAGGEQEKLQKKTMALFAAMQLLAATEQFANLVRKGSVINTLLLVPIQNLYTVAVTSSTVALKAFRLALLGSGIGAAALAIGFLVERFVSFANAAKKAREEQKEFNDVMKEANKDAGKQIANLKELTTEAANLSLPINERIKAVSELQKTFPEYFGNLTQEAILTGNITDAYNKQVLAIEALSQAKAAQSKIDELEAKRLDVIFENEQKKTETIKKNAAAVPTKAVAPTPGGFLPATATEGKSVPEQITENTKELSNVLVKNSKVIEGIDQQIQFYLGFVTKAQNLPKPDVIIRNKVFLDKAIKEIDDQLQFMDRTNVKFEQLTKERASLVKELKALEPQKDTKAPENTFEQEKADLEAKLKETRKEEVTTITKINEEFAAKLEVERLRIEKEIKDKKLTGSITDTKSQAGIIFTLTAQVNKKGLDEAIAEFQLKMKDVRDKLEQEIVTLTQKANVEQINNIRDEFDRRSKLIEVNETDELQQLTVANEKRVATLETLRKTDQITQEQYYKDLNDLTSLYSEERTNIVVKAAHQREDLSIAIFKDMITRWHKALEDSNITLETEVTSQITATAALFKQGKISYEKFTEDIDDIQRKSATRIRQANIRETESEILAVKIKLDGIRDIHSEAYKALEEELKKLLKELNRLQVEDAVAGAKQIDAAQAKKIASVVGYTQAIGNLAQSIAKFWQDAAAIEEQTLQRSIDLQEKRVEEARRIADKGNAAYLKEEQDRLKKLRVEYENNARRQLAINAVVQESEAITAVITTIAQGAKLGPIGVIADVAAILTLIASTFALVKSISPPPPTLERGTTFVQRGSHPQGRDTIPAMLDEGEAVIPKDTNREYQKSVEAIYERAVPAKELNRFVTIYQKEKDISKVINTLSTIHNTQGGIPTVINKILTSNPQELPTLRHDKLHEANEVSISNDGKLSGLLQEQNKLLLEDIELHRGTQQILKHMGVDIKIDKDGVSAMVMKGIEQKKIDSKT